MSDIFVRIKERMSNIKIRNFDKLSVRGVKTDTNIQQMERILLLSQKRGDFQLFSGGSKRIENIKDPI